MPEDQILLTGSSGLIGTSLMRLLVEERIHYRSLIRKKSADSPGSAASQPLWDPYSEIPVADPRILDGTTAAVHLSGVDIAGGRWTADYKRQIMESRVQPTRALATLVARLRPRPEALVCASAIGIYGNRGDELLTEESSPGDGFLAEVCLEWEKATQPAADAGIRVVHARFGVVLSPGGGALARMLPLFRLGLGGPLGDGRQWVSWVALPDAVRAIAFALRRPSLSGGVNVVSPNPVIHLDFARDLGKALHRPAILPAPAFALKLAFGEMADSTVLGSERVIPEKLGAAGFLFQYPGLEAALRALLQRA